MLEQVIVPPLSLDAFAPYAGDDAVEELRRLAAPLRDARVLHVNATKFGGGVAEILPTLTALMRDAGLDAEWRVIPGDDPFFDVTKRIHNGLQGMAVPFDDAPRETFARASRGFAAAWDGEYDYVVINDDVEQAVGRLRAIVEAERSRLRVMRPAADTIIRNFHRAAVRGRS